MKSEKSIVLLGAGGQAKETLSYAADLDIDVEFWCVSDKFAPKDSSVPFVSLENLLPKNLESLAICAVGAPQVKRNLVLKWTSKKFFSLISPSSYIGLNSFVGAGVTVAPHAVITSGVTVGEHVLINVAATISHDAVIGDFVTIGPGAKIGGSVSIGEGSVIGIGATIVNGISIGRHTYIGAGAVVTKDIPDNVIAFGVPAQVMKEREGWIDEL